MNKNRKRLEEIVLALLVFVGLIFAIIGIHYSIHEKELLEEARQAGYEEGLMTAIMRATRTGTTLELTGWIEL